MKTTRVPFVRHLDEGVAGCVLDIEFCEPYEESEMKRAIALSVCAALVAVFAVGETAEAGRHCGRRVRCRAHRVHHHHHCCAPSCCAPTTSCCDTCGSTCCDSGCSSCDSGCSSCGGGELVPAAPADGGQAVPAPAPVAPGDAAPPEPNPNNNNFRSAE